MDDLQCETPNCTKAITQKVADYSKRIYNGKIYCFDCQKELKTEGAQPQETPAPAPRPEYKGHGKEAPHGKVLTMDDKITLGQAINLVYGRAPPADLGNIHQRKSFKEEVTNLFELLKEIKEEIK